jgi:CheY-like chemotaxis protein
VVLVDYCLTLVELLAGRLERDGHRAVAVGDPEQAVEHAKAHTFSPPGLALIGVRYPDKATTGLDVAMAFRRWCPETSVVLFADERTDDQRFLAEIWDVVQPAGAVSKSSSTESVVSTLGEVLLNGWADVDLGPGFDNFANRPVW